MLREYGLPLSSIVGATVGALLIAKVVLITDKFPFINRFPGKPLIYNVAWKTAILHGRGRTHSLPGAPRGRSVRTGRPGHGESSSHDRDRLATLLGHSLWLIVLLFVYCSLREMVPRHRPRKVVDLSSDAAPPEFSSGYRTRSQLGLQTWTG